MRMLVLGSGLQGSACALDLLNSTDASVTLADRSPEHLAPFLTQYRARRLAVLSVDARDEENLREVMRGQDAVCCALPYYLNVRMMKLAIEAGAHFCDLGGNTEIVFKQRDELDAAAKAKGISVIPDTGLAPGLVNVLAEMGIRACDDVSAVRLYVGGLPQHPHPPLNYQLVYSLYGVIDYYTTPSWVLRNGKRTNVIALSEREPIKFDSLGELEAFHTAGGLSTMAFRYEGKVPTMEYKTLRYPGHAQLVEAIRDLGFFGTDPVQVNGQRVVPRELSVAVMDKKLRMPTEPDLVALRVVVEGKKAGKPVRKEWDLVDKFDEKRGITSMMRTTGYSLSITGQMQANGEIPVAGVHTPDECVPAAKYLAALKDRGIVVKQTGD